jgi:hypothetical protein
VDVVLTLGGKIAGRVLGDLGDLSVTVQALNVACLGDNPKALDWYRRDLCDPVAAWSNPPRFPPSATGAYELAGLDGSYKLMLNANPGATQWYGGASFAEARTFEVRPGEVITGIDLTREFAAGGFSGRATTGSDCTDADGFNLELFRADGTPLHALDWYFALGYNDPWGQLPDEPETMLWANYDVVVPPGDYKVRLVPPAPWLPQFYSNKPDLASADTIHVGPGLWVPGVDARFEKAP